MHIRQFIAFVVFACLTIPLANANGIIPFNTPPETNAPPGGWVYNSPYQRNVMIDFATDPGTWPDEPLGGMMNQVAGPHKDLVPGGNYGAWGFDDPTLYPSDWFGWEGTYDWVDTDPSGRQGLFGINDRDYALLDFVWHLDNDPIEHPVKHIWIEMEYLFTPDNLGSEIGQLWLWPGITASGLQSATTDAVLIELLDLGNDLWREVIWVQVEPNPLYEDFQFSLDTDRQGLPGTLLFDYIHIATESVTVPEPATLALLGAGLAGLGFSRRRKSA